MSFFNSSKLPIFVFIALSVLSIGGIFFFKYATARPLPGTTEDSIYQSTHGPIATPDTTLSDTLFYTPTDSPLVATDTLVL